MRSRHSRHRRTFHQRLFDDSTLLLHASLLPLGGPRLAHPRCDLSRCCPGSVHLRSKWTLSNRVHQARVSSLHTPVQTVSAGRLPRVRTRRLWMFLCAYSGFVSVGGVGGGPPISFPRIIPGHMDSICVCIRSMCVTTVSHMSTLFRQRDSSFGSLIVRMLAFISASEDFSFSMSAFMASISCLCISTIFWRRSARIWLPPAGAGSCAGAFCAHIT